MRAFQFDFSASFIAQFHDSHSFSSILQSPILQRFIEFCEIGIKKEAESQKSRTKAEKT